VPPGGLNPMRVLAIVSTALLATACSRPPEGPSVPKREDGAKNGRIIEMNKSAQAQAGVAAVPALVEKLTESLNVTGTVQPVDSRVAHVRPLARGRIEDILVRVGDRVRQGQALASFDNLEAGDVISQHRAAQAELRKSQVVRQAATRRRERNANLVERGAVARKELEASQAEEQAADEAIRAQESVVAGLAARLRRFGTDPDREGPPVSAIGAPIAGIVIGVAAAPGEVIEAGAELFTVADISMVWVQAEVYEKDLGLIRTGQTAAVQIDTYADRQFPARVAYIGDVVDPKTRTVKVRCEVANPEVLLKLDMFATIKLPTVTGRDAVAVPESAIQQFNGRPIVFVRRSGEAFEVRPVTVGIRARGLAEIASGVAAGDMVVTEGSFHLKSVLLERQIEREE
jgi:membrane fusion protein, heavy metal efflux system